jgi:BirA family biotin operon repressor/biotin-[acetyl-CoA-carboxylase] ligase
LKKLYLTSPDEEKSGIFFINLLELLECRSTNDYIFEHMDSLSGSAPLLVSAKIQTSGRGREGRKWLSAGEGGMYISFLIRITNREGLLFLSIAAGTAVAESILAETGITVDIKWPNDIEISASKAGGILVENRLSGDDIMTVTGIGLNVNSCPGTWEENPSPSPTSLMNAAGRRIDIDELRRRISGSFIQFIRDLEKNRTCDLLDRYLKFLKHIPGEKLSFHSGGITVQGHFSKINSRGGLVLKLENGNEKTFFSGEIIGPGGEKIR